MIPDPWPLTPGLWSLIPDQESHPLRHYELSALTADSLDALLVELSDHVTMRLAVLDGGVAVRCNPKPALAGLKSRSRSCVDRTRVGSAALKVWSCAATTFEPCQVRKEAAVRSARRVPQGNRARVSGSAAVAARRSKTGARPIVASGATARPGAPATPRPVAVVPG